MLFRYAAALAVLMTAAPAFAGELKPYDQVAFETAQGTNAAIVIHVTAPWCPTCRAQKPIVLSLLDDLDNADVTVFEIDFDSRQDVLRALNVRQQSTLIAYRGATETDRAVGITDPVAIATLFATTR